MYLVAEVIEDGDHLDKEFIRTILKAPKQKQNPMKN
jgi:hypothetical protein